MIAMPEKLHAMSTNKELKDTVNGEIIFQGIDIKAGETVKHLGIISDIKERCK